MWIFLLFLSTNMVYFIYIYTYIYPLITVKFLSLLNNDLLTWWPFIAYEESFPSNQGRWDFPITRGTVYAVLSLCRDTVETVTWGLEISICTGLCWLEPGLCQFEPGLCQLEPGLCELVWTWSEIIMLLYL